MTDEEKREQPTTDSDDYCERPARGSIKEKMERPEPWPDPPPTAPDEKE